MVMVKLNQKQIERMSEISGNLSLLFLGAIVFPALTQEAKFDTIPVILGALDAIMSFTLSISLLSKKRRRKKV
jgi:hypothetical protein